MLPARQLSVRGSLEQSERLVVSSSSSTALVNYGGREQISEGPTANRASQNLLASGQFI